MGETANGGIHDPTLEHPLSEQSPAAGLLAGDFVDEELREAHDTTGSDFLDEESREGLDMAGELEAVYAGWLERRGIDPAGIPRLKMGRREFDLFRGAPDNYIGQAREIYGIPSGDQVDCQYALVEVETDDPSLPPTPELMTVNEADFGTMIDFDRVAADFQDTDQDPDNPLMPKPEGTVRIIDIQDTIAASVDDLHSFTSGLMEGKTTDPFAEGNGDIAIRAGDVAAWQKDAYVWTGSAITKSVELTIALPHTYDSVCVVSGQMREAGNGKAHMAQIDNPTVLLKIDGENLAKLQRTYHKLYKEPDFALSQSQRDTRDGLFNDYVKGLISEEARKNRVKEQARQDDERRFRQQPLKARQLPRP
jgi:hypothetical protein